MADRSHRPYSRRAVAVAALCAAAVIAPFAVAGAREGTPTGTVVASAGTPVPGSYLVLLKDRAAAPATVTDRARALSERYTGAVSFVYTAAVRGFAVRMTAARAARLAADPLVATVAEDTVVHATGTQSPAPWGLDRTDQRAGPPDGSYTYATTASSVHAYVIDTGIRTTHTQFGGRASVGTDTVGDGRNGQDCDGHGTHVAGTLGGSTYGMAKGVSLVAVRVLDCSGSGTASGVVAGISWVTAHAVKPAVANLSLGGATNSVLDAAVAASIASGVTYTVAAGNDSRNACTVSPARVPGAITVGSTDVTDTRDQDTNFGTCLDVFAPGVAIESAGAAGDTATARMSGTSMATPHVAGAAALYLAGSPDASPAQVRDALVGHGTQGVVAGAGTGSPDVLLYTGTGPDQPGPTTTQPAPTTTRPAPTTTAAPPRFPTRPGTSTTPAPPTTTRPAPTTTRPAPTTTRPAPTTTRPSVTFPGRPAAPVAVGPWNDSRLPIPDGGTVTAGVTVAPRAGSAGLRVSVTIRHGYRGDLALDLVSPDGVVRPLKTASFLDPAPDLVADYAVRVPAAQVGGVWTLRVRDAYVGDTGALESWGIAG